MTMSQSSAEHQIHQFKSYGLHLAVVVGKVVRFFRPGFPADPDGDAFVSRLRRFVGSVRGRLILAETIHLAATLKQVYRWSLTNQRTKSRCCKDKDKFKFLDKTKWPSPHQDDGFFQYAKILLPLTTRRDYEA